MATLKEGLYRSLVWQTEIYASSRETNNGTVKPKGWFTMVEYQLSRTLFLGARYEFAQSPDKSFSGRWFSFAITLFPSEFGRYRLQWSRLKIGGELSTKFGFKRPSALASIAPTLCERLNVTRYHSMAECGSTTASVVESYKFVLVKEG